MKNTIYLILLIVGWAYQAQAQKVLEYKQHYHTGQAQLKAGQYEAAIASLDKAIERMPYYSAIYAERGKAKLKAKDYAGAVEDLTIALQKKSYDAKAYLHRGIAYYHLQNYNYAEYDLKDALHYSPRNREAKQYLDKTLAQQEALRQAALNQQNEILANQNRPNQRNDWERRQRRFYRNQLIWGTIVPLAIWTGILLWR
jgi:tetratricopeptide (TPR) repeat protein